MQNALLLQSPFRGTISKFLVCTNSLYYQPDKGVACTFPPVYRLEKRGRAHKFPSTSILGTCMKGSFVHHKWFYEI